MNLAGKNLFAALFYWVTAFQLCAQTTWSVRHESAPGGAFLWSIAEGDAGLVAVGAGGTILRSTDGQTWTRTISGTAEWLVAVAYLNGQYITVGDHGTILRSSDGATWVPSSSAVSQRLNNVAYGFGKYIAVGEAGTIVISNDAVTWTPVASGVTGWLRGLALSDFIVVATGQGGVTAYSHDGVKWTRLDSGLNADLEAVTLENSYEAKPPKSGLSSTFVAVGANGSVAQFDYSAFGPGSTYTWRSLRNTGVPVQLRSISLTKGVFLVTGEDGTVLKAKWDSGPWTRTNVPTTANIVAAGRGLGSLFLVGANETILQSEQIIYSQFVNISSRGFVGNGENALVLGTVVTGDSSKHILVRGVGPGLTDFQVPNVLAQPILEVYDGSGKLLSTHTRWELDNIFNSVEDARKKVNAFPLREKSNDCSIVFTAGPGAYTFVLKGANNTNGVALLEAYDLDDLNGISPRSVNVSTRGYVGTNENILIGGIVIQGPGSRQVLIRGVGPTLAQFGVTGVLADPILQLYSGDTLIASNDNWGDTTIVNGQTVTAGAMTAASDVAHVFPLADGSKDAAILITLPPGAYTFQVRGANGGTGIALVEAYEMPRTE